MQNPPLDLKKTGLKKTGARLAVIDILKKEEKPLDVASIIKELRNRDLDTNQVTVYRILANFEVKNLVNRIEFGEGKSRYEINRGKHHHHLVCTNCGSVEDVEGVLIDKLEKDITKKKNFKVQSHSLEFFGICEKCQ